MIILYIQVELNIDLGEKLVELFSNLNGNNDNKLDDKINKRRAFLIKNLPGKYMNMKYEYYYY